MLRTFQTWRRVRRYCGPLWFGAVLALFSFHSVHAVTVSASPTTCANVTGVGTIAWNNPTRAITSNNSFATAAVDGTTSNYLVCTGYNFAIPVGATINGITVNVERRSNSTANGGSRDAAMRLVKAGVIGTTDRSTATLYTTADVIEAHGGAADLWGTTWSAADINAANFGAAFAATKPSAAGGSHTISVDHIRITVDYSYSPGTYSLSANPTTCTSVVGIGTVAWTNPARAISSNNSFATASVDGTVTRYLRCTGYNFAIPAGATINGITVNVERRSNSTANGGSRDAAMRVVKAGVIGVTDRSSATIYTRSDVIEAHGGTADLWGTTWTAADINAANFGAAFAATKANAAGGAHTVSVDHVWITVTFTLAGGQDHIHLEHDGAGITCAPEPITSVKACANASCSTLYTGGGVSGSLTPNGSAFSIGVAGFTTGSVNPTTAGTYTLGVTGVSPASSGSPAVTCLNTVTNAASCSIVFTAGGMSVAIPNFPAGTGTTTATITVTDPRCQPLFAGNRSIQIYTSYTNPNSGTMQVSVNGTPVSTVAASPTTLTLNFNVSGVSTLTINYADVGRMTLYVRDVVTGTNGSGTFVAYPTDFLLSAIQRTSPVLLNPGAANAAGARFVAAGEDFSVTVTARNSLGNATPNFGRESPAEGVTLTSALIADPDLTNNPAIGGTFGAFSNGSASGTAFTWDEVGIITLMPSLTSGNYLSSGVNVTGLSSGNVGRFYLHHFDVTPDATTPIRNRADTACAACTFTYMGERMDAQFTLIAQALNNATTLNYTGSYAKLNLTVIGNPLGFGAVDTAAPTYLTSRLDTTGGVTGNFVLGEADLVAAIAITRLATADGPYAALQIGIAPVDADGAAMDAFDLNADATPGNDHALIGSTQVRFGRMRIANAHGSERLPLLMPITTQYWNGTAFITNTDDNNTALLISDIVLSNYQKNLNSGETTVTVPSFVNGVGQIGLSAPGSSNNGSVDINTNAPTYLPSNTARATFGIYKSGPLIYQRENF